MPFSLNQKINHSTYKFAIPFHKSLDLHTQKH
jgi:hypothetical protein